MEKEQKEIELKKIEIEKLKTKIEIFKILVAVFLSVGAGIGAILYRKYNEKILDNLFLVILLTTATILLIAILAFWIKINREVKTIERELKQWKH